jgi:hypothetical protein
MKTLQWLELRSLEQAGLALAANREEKWNDLNWRDSLPRWKIKS